MAVFVCGLNPNGAASRNGGIQVGDEILEVTTNCLPCLPFNRRSSMYFILLGTG
jgi:MOSC domain-containing protein YiiM